MISCLGAHELGTDQLKGDIKILFSGQIFLTSDKDFFKTVKKLINIG